MFKLYILLLSLFLTICDTQNEQKVCSDQGSKCETININKYNEHTYIFYDVNKPEGFNLRRDVYIRMATFVKILNKMKIKRYVLVLPPWSELFHWKSKHLNQNSIPWNEFFDVDSLNKYVPVVEMKDYFAYHNIWNKDSLVIDEVFILKHFEEMFETGNFQDKYEYTNDCKEKTELNDLWGYSNVTFGTVKCLKFQGTTSLLKNIIKDSKANSIMFAHAEIPLHDTWGSPEFWRARRSMRFSQPLVKLANDFRKTYLNSTDDNDNTLRPLSWKDEKYSRNAIGGNYISVHLRRQDFLWGRSKHIPNIKYAAQQIEKNCNKLQIFTVFLATDAFSIEISDLRSFLEPKIKVYTFKPTSDIEMKIKDGGKAIVEQIICSHAKYFIGTYESTFSFRIQEEREILGFPKTTTFNRLCGDKETDKKCSQTTVWSIMF